MTEPRRISSGVRLFLAVVVSIVVIGAATVSVVAAAIYHAGSVEVEVVESGGDRISLSVPTTLVVAAVQLVPDDLIQEAAGEMEPWWPVVHEASRELVRCPDAVLVQVDGPDESVRVAKRGGELVVDVRDGGDRVHVVVPVRTISAVLDKLDGAVF